MRSTIRRTLLPLSLIVIGSAALCDRDKTGLRSDGVPATANSFLPVDYELTSELYNKWLVAQENLNREAGDADLGPPASRVSVMQPTPEGINTIVARLEGNDRTRRAIESSGLSARDYVLTTLALYQALRAPGSVTVAQLRPGNVELVSLNRAQIARVRTSSRFQIAHDRDTDTDGDTDNDTDRDTDNDTDDDEDDDTDGDTDR